MTASQHPGEGRETGWDELRREIEALPDVNPTPTLHAGAHTDWPMVKRADVLRLLAAARGELETLPRAEYARLKGIEDIARLIVSGWASGFPVDDGSGERDLIDRLGAFIEEGR